MTVVDILGTEVVYSDGVWSSNDTVLNLALSTLEELIERDAYNPDPENEIVTKVLEKLGQGTIIYEDEKPKPEPGTIY